MRFAHPLLLAPLLAVTAIWLTLPGAAALLRADSHVQHEPIRLLELLPGRWKGEQTAGGARLLESVQWERVLANRFLRCQLEATDPITGNVTYEGTGFLRHDSTSNGYSFHWFDSNGRAERYVGRAVDEALEFDAVEPAVIGRLVFRAEESGYTCVASRKTEAEALEPVFASHYRPVRKDKAQRDQDK